MSKSYGYVPVVSDARKLRSLAGGPVATLYYLGRGNPNLDGCKAVKAFRKVPSDAARTRWRWARSGRRQFSIRSIRRIGAEASGQRCGDSKTFARQLVNGGIQELQRGPYNSAMEGKPLRVGRQLWRKVMGARPAARQKMEHRLLGHIANMLTGRRGLRRSMRRGGLMKAYKADDRVGRVLSGALAVPGYQTGMRALGHRRPPAKDTQYITAAV